MSNRHQDKRGTLNHPCRPTGGDMSGVPCDYPLVCHASGGDTGGVRLCVPPSTPTHLMQCGGVPDRGACPVGFQCQLSDAPGAPGHCVANTPVHVMTCKTGSDCPRNFTCAPSKSGLLGAPGHCEPLRVGPGGQHKPVLGGFSYQCVNGLGCHLVQEPASAGTGRYSNYQTCKDSCSVPTTVQTYYQCGGKQGVSCTGPHPGFANPKQGKYSTMAECQGGTVCGKPVPMHMAWPDWDAGVGSSDPFKKIMAKTGNIHEPIQNYMGSLGPGPQKTHMYRPGQNSSRGTRNK